jgi:hypothetical protein
VDAAIFDTGSYPSASAVITIARLPSSKLSGISTDSISWPLPSVSPENSSPSISSISKSSKAFVLLELAIRASASSQSTMIPSTSDSATPIFEDESSTST